MMPILLLLVKLLQQILGMMIMCIIETFFFKCSAPFLNCTLKINSQLIEDAQDLDIVIPMYNLLYYSKNFRKTTESFRNYYPDIRKSGHDNSANLGQRVIYLIIDSESFNYKTRLLVMFLVLLILLMMMTLREN